MTTNTLIRKLSLSAAGISIALITLAASTGLATANTNQTIISIPVETVVWKIGVGNTKVLASETVDEKYRDMICSVSASAENQGSVHPGNDLVITSGNDSVTLSDVERASGVETTSNGALTLDQSVSVALVMGQDDVFSAGMDVVLTCEEDPEIEVCRDGEIIPIKESQRADGDTDTCKEIEVCRDGEITKITEDKKEPTDTETCPTPEEIKVCRGGKQIVVTEDNVKPGDLKGDCPKTLGTQTLPNTGAGLISGLAMGLSTITTGVYGFIRSRK